MLENGTWVVTIYADVCKKYAGLRDFQDALKDLEKYYKDICKKIDTKIEEEHQAMYGWMKNDNDEYDEDDEQNELYYEGIADDAREEWEEEDLADYIEYVQDWEIYTATYN